MEEHVGTRIIGGKIGLGLLIAFLLMMSGISAISANLGLDDSVTVSASSPNQATPSNSSGCAVGYSSQFTGFAAIPVSSNGDYVQLVAPGYYIVGMACTNAANTPIFLSLTHNGMQVSQNGSHTVTQIGVNTSIGHGTVQRVYFYWHDGVNQDSGVISLVPVLNQQNDPTPRISMWPGKVNQHNWNGTWLTDPDGSSGGHPSTDYASDYGDRKVDYCQKWWPNAYAVQLLPLRETITFYTAGNQVPYVSTRDVYECLLNGTVPTPVTPPAGNNSGNSSGNGTVPGSGNGTPPVGNGSSCGGNGTVPGSGNGTNPPVGNGSSNGGNGTVPGSGNGTPPMGNGSSSGGSGTVPGSGNGTSPPAGNGTVPGGGNGTSPPAGNGSSNGGIHEIGDAAILDAGVQAVKDVVSSVDTTEEKIAATAMVGTGVFSMLGLITRFITRGAL